MGKGEDIDYSEVIELTEYSGGGTVSKSGGASYGIEEYKPISIISTEEKYQKQAQELVTKIKNFIKKYGGDEDKEGLDAYLDNVAELEISGLADMMQLCQINKQMIYNMVERVNSTMAEDYAAIQTYNTLVSQQMKLMKELQIRYKSIPMVMKRMKTDVITDQILSDNDDNVQGVIGENHGKSQFNNGRELYNMLNSGDDDEDDEFETQEAEIIEDEK